MKKKIYKCMQCSLDFYRYISTVRNEKKVFCCTDCYGKYLAETQCGCTNSNYNNRWTPEQKSKQSDIIKSKVDDEYRKKCATARKGKKFIFSKEHIENMKTNRLNKIHTIDSKLLIGNIPII